MRIGQGVLGRVPFRDGTMPEYNRTYLVVGLESSGVKLLNVSSLAGKEHKLFFSTNRLIKNYKPPFQKKSFVKLDSLITVSNTQIKSFKLLHGGACLDKEEVNGIIASIIR